MVHCVEVFLVSLRLACFPINVLPSSSNEVLLGLMDQTNGPAVNRQGLQMNCKKPGKDIKTKDILNTFQDFKNFNVIFDINEGKYPTFTFSNTTNEIFLIGNGVNFTLS